MSTIKLKGNSINTSGELPAVNTSATDFKLVKTDLSEISLSDLKGRRVVLNIFPSIDTGTCAASVRKFNELASKLENTTILCVSRDLPFAQQRFCGAEGLDNVLPVSDFRDGSFGKSYGLLIEDGPLKGLHSRAVVVIDEHGTIRHTEQVGDIVDEPNYDAALASLS
ncbi:MAG: thiol peroxidase [Flavobacterium sp.]|nr:thiol peroxidase [Flavobacterium sp.]